LLIRSCDYCPSKDQCRQYWKDSEKQFETCIDGIDSKQVCTRFGFCSVSTLCVNMGVYQQACEESLSAFTLSLEHDPKTLEQHLPHTSVVVLPTKAESEETNVLNDSNSTCILCEFVMNILSNYVHSQSTEEEIEKSLEKVCSQMPSTLQKQCHELMDNYGPVIIATLLREFDVATICRKLNLCTSQMKVELSHLTKANMATCGICDYVSTYVNFALKRDSSEKSLQHALSTVCSHLSTEQSPQCQTLVQLFAPHIRKLQLDLGNNFCKQLTICQTPNAVLKPSVVETDVLKQSLIHLPSKKDESVKEDDEIKRILVKNLDDTPQCTLCHYVVSYLDAVLKNNKSEAAIEAALAKVCTILPSEFIYQIKKNFISNILFLGKERAECNEFVKTYGPVLAELIAEMADPDTICRYLGACQATLPKETTTKKSTPALPHENTPFTCTICQFVISRMKHYVALNQTEEEILVSLKESCDLFSVINLKQQCKNFLDQYGSYIIQMVSSDVEPKAACQSIGICEKNNPAPSSHRPQSTPPVPISSSAPYGKCIYGMNYWCTSRQNAELCNVI
jgi:saposin